MPLRWMCLCAHGGDDDDDDERVLLKPLTLWCDCSKVFKNQLGCEKLNCSVLVWCLVFKKK